MKCTGQERDWPSALLIAQGSASMIGAVTMAGMLNKRDDSSFRERPRIFGRYALVYLLEGRGYFRDGHGIFADVTAGDVIWVFPEIPHAYGPRPGGRWKELFLVFSGTLFDLCRKEGLLDPSQPIWRAVPVAYWRERLQSLLPKRTPAPPLQTLGTACRLLEVITELRANCQTPEIGREDAPAWLSVACQLLADPDGPGLEMVARRVKLSYESFRKQFSAATGCSPGRYRIIRRVEFAARLLREGERPLKEIAKAAGFADEFHFARRFKQAAGITPGAFRRQGRG